MKKTEEMKKTERFDFRCNSEIKGFAKKRSHEQGITASEYICNLIKKDQVSISHEEQMEHALIENQLINDLLASDELPLKYKKLIGEELKKYV